MGTNGSQGQVLNLLHVGAADVKRRIAEGNDTVVVPIGSCERHGNPFTPLGLDGLVGQEVVERAAARADVLYAPSLPFGYAPQHMGETVLGAGGVAMRGETYRRVVEDVARSLIYQGFTKLVFISFHSDNVEAAQEVLFSLRFRTGAFVAFYGAREAAVTKEVFADSPPHRLTSDQEAAMAMALLGDRFRREEWLSQAYRIHAPEWLGDDFDKVSGAGQALWFDGAANVYLGLNDFEYTTPIEDFEPPPSAATAEKGHAVLDGLADHLAAFLERVKEVRVDVAERAFPERAR